MKRPLYHILRLFLVAMTLLLTMAPAVAQTNTVYAGQTSDLGVEEVPGTTYTWELYTDDVSINFATVPGNCPPADAFFNGSNTGPTVSVTWVTPAVYYFKVTAEDENGCSNIRIGMMTVLEALPYAVIEDPSPICKGDDATLIIELTGDAPWSIDVFDGTSTITYNNILASPYILTLTPNATTTYTVTSVTDINGTNTNPSNTVTLTVNPKPGSSRIYQYEPLTKKK
ncbi:MAG: hypothetical protein V1775_13535 [Bacteroidota bacterium]